MEQRRTKLIKLQEESKLTDEQTQDVKSAILLEVGDVECELTKKVHSSKISHEAAVTKMWQTFTFANRMGCIEWDPMLKWFGDFCSKIYNLRD